MNKETFVEIIKNKDIEELNKIPKSDLHVHSTRGCNRRYFEKLYNIKFNNIPKFNSISEMDSWYNNNLDIYTGGLKGFLLRLEYLVRQNNEHNVIMFAPSFCLDMCKNFDYSLKKYIEYLQKIFKLYGKNINILPELSVKRTDDLEQLEKEFDQVLKYNFFKSIDLMGDEKLGTKKFIEIYKKARNNGLILKAHVGEFTEVKFIEEALDNLDLDCINHGLSLIQSKELMDYVSNKEIMVNTCPSSNVYLARVDSYKNHPIKKFIDNDIICTINTDDEIIFNQSIEEEYMNLYNNGCLSPEELYIVNQNGLTKSLKKRKQINY